MADPRPFAVEYLENPSQEELRTLAFEHTPATQRTIAGTVNKVARNKARMAKYTYVLDDRGADAPWSVNAIDKAKGRELIARQKAYIEEAGTLIAIDAYVGLGQRAFGVTWLYTPEGANIAGMQQVLSFTRGAVESPAQLKELFAPTFRLIYTPNLFLDDMPGRQAILVDIESYTTHVMGADYFGESKKGVLRMLNEYVFQKGGLVLHAGAKAVTRRDGSRVTMTVMGLSGTGKTTTTFSKQGELTEPIQDDMVCLWPRGELSITENGCFAKIDGLSAESEPVIHAGTVGEQAWLENAFLEPDGSCDFFKGVVSPDEVARLRDVLVRTGADAANVDKYIAGEVKAEEVVNELGVPADGWDFVVWTQNGRSIIPMSTIPGAADLHDVPPVKSMGILNRDEGADPAWSAPTSYFAAVQALGRATVIDDEPGKAAVLNRQFVRLQPEGGHNAVEPGSNPFGKMLKGIRAVRLTVDDVRVKIKVGGNRTRAVQERVAAHLAERAEGGDLAARAHLLRRSGLGG